MRLCVCVGGGVYIVRNLHVGEGDDANAAVWTPRRLSQVFHPDHPVGHRRALPTAQVHRLPSQRPQTRLLQLQPAVLLAENAANICE